MITGFEEITQPLSEYEEKTLLPVIAYGLSLKVGKAMAVTNKEIVTAMKLKKYVLDGPRLRKIISHIRVHGLVKGLIATSDGYYIATSDKELAEYEESLKGREDAIRAVRLSIRKQRNEMFAPKQASLFG